MKRSGAADGGDLAATVVSVRDVAELIDWAAGLVAERDGAKPRGFLAVRFFGPERGGVVWIDRAGTGHTIVYGHPDSYDLHDFASTKAADGGYEWLLRFGPAELGGVAP